MNGLVSIIIPCFNADRWVGSAIQSALDQSYRPVEVVVIDDGSTDQSLEVIKSFGERIRWQTGQNRGGNVARNRGLELSQGEWLQYLDADDYLLPNKILRQMEFANRNLHADIIFSPVTMEYWSEIGSRLELLSIPYPHDPWALLTRWYLLQTGALLSRKAAVLDVGGWNERQPCCQEHELCLRLLTAGKRFLYCPHGGAVYRHWSEQTVCKRDKPETRRRCLEIKQRAEDYLLARNELTADRHSAINSGRFKIARSAWQYNHAEAVRIMAVIRQSQPGFRPSTDAAPILYRVAYRLLGFQGAEILADCRRCLSALTGTN